MLCVPWGTASRTRAARHREGCFHVRVGWETTRNSRKSSSISTGTPIRCSCTENGLIPARVIATSFSLLAFAAAVAVGAYVGNDATTVLWRGIAVMLVCYLIGRILGSVAQRTIDDHTSRHASEHPVPESVEDLPTASSNTEAVVG